MVYSNICFEMNFPAIHEVFPDPRSTWSTTPDHLATYSCWRHVQSPRASIRLAVNIDARYPWLVNTLSVNPNFSAKDQFKNVQALCKVNMQRQETNQNNSMVGERRMFKYWYMHDWAKLPFFEHTKNFADKHFINISHTHRLHASFCFFFNTNHITNTSYVILPLQCIVSWFIRHAIL